MKKTLLFLLSCLFLVLMSCSKDDDKDSEDGTTDTPQSTDGKVTFLKKYEVKSGIIKFTEYSDILDETTTYKVFFDEYGGKEVKYEYDAKGALTDITMEKGDGWYYQISIKNGGTKTSSPYADGTEMKFDLNWTEKQKTEYNFKMLSDTTIAGKVCKRYSMDASESISGIYAGYKGVTLYQKSISKGSFTFYVEAKAVSFEENVAINDTVWKLPANITITESKY
ncbi:MAG TPA: hypothetical protein PK252_09760 [Bacteroidales bacterium]|nr:hypothetical protein [Bacteroidales bacterium]